MCWQLQLEHFQIPTMYLSLHYISLCLSLSLSSPLIPPPLFLSHPFLYILHRSTTRPDNLLTDFVCWRGLMTKLLCTPYNKVRCIMYLKPTIHYATCCTVLHRIRTVFYPMQKVAPKDYRKTTSTWQQVAYCMSGFSSGAMEILLYIIVCI